MLNNPLVGSGIVSYTKSAQCEAEQQLAKAVVCFGPFVPNAGSYVSDGSGDTTDFVDNSEDPDAYAPPVDDSMADMEGDAG